MSTASTIKSLAAYDLIRDMILSGEALPGTRLVLVDLEKKLGVGRGPIRDALMRLDKSGLGQNIPYKGAIVMMPPSSKEIEHIFNLRIQVECALARAHSTCMRRLKMCSISLEEGGIMTMAPL